MSKFLIEFNIFNKIVSKYHKISDFFDIMILKERYVKNKSYYNRLVYIEVSSKISYKNYIYCGTIFNTTNEILVTYGTCDINLINRCKCPNTKTYIVFDGNDYIELNKKDLCKILGIDSIYPVTQIENLFIELRDNKYNPENGMEKYYDTYQILAYSKRVIDKYGYVKILDRSHYNVRSTKTQVQLLLDSCSQYNELEYKDTLSWILQYNGDNNFIQNGRMLIENRYILEQDISKIIPIYILYKNDIKVNKFEYYSNIGRFIDVDVNYSEYRGSYFQDSIQIYVYEFISKGKYSFIVQTYEPIDFYEFVVHISGYVKSFNVYKNEKQTVLERVKFTTYL